MPGDLLSLFTKPTCSHRFCGGCFFMRKNKQRRYAKGRRKRKSLDGDKGALLYGVTRLPRSASCGAWMPVRTVILCVALLRTRGCTPCDASHLSLHSHEESSLDARLLFSWLFLLVRRASLDNAKRMQYNHMNFL